MNANDLTLLARAEVRELASYNAGLAADAVRKRFGLTRVAKLGSNENPMGTAPLSTPRPPKPAMRLRCTPTLAARHYAPHSRKNLMFRKIASCSATVLRIC